VYEIRNAKIFSMRLLLRHNQDASHLHYNARSTNMHDEIPKNNVNAHRDIFEFAERGERNVTR